MATLDQLYFKQARPFVWGFFVFAFLAGIVVGLRAYRVSTLQSDWSGHLGKREAEIRDVVTSSFAAHVRELFEVAREAQQDLALLEDLSSTIPANILRAYNRIAEYQRDGNVSIEFVNQHGEVVLWAGRSTKANYSVGSSLWADTVVTLTQSDLHTYLSVRVGVSDKSLFVVVSRALEVNYPISNRFVTPISFSAMVAEELNEEVRLQLTAPSAPPEGDLLSLPLNDVRGQAVGYAVVTKPSLESEIQRVSVQYEVWISVLGGLALLMLVGLAFHGLYRATPRVVSLLFLTAVLWGLRYAWLWIGFPRLLIGTRIFDPGIYSTPFGGGIAESLGETVLSTLVLGVNVILWLAELPKLLQTWGKTSSRPRHWRLLVVPFLVAAFLYVTQGFGEALRSFVFDSTLQYHDPTTLVPGGALMIMHLTILPLTVVYVSICVGLVLSMVQSVNVSVSRPLAVPRQYAFVAVAFILIWIVLQIIPVTTKFPRLYPLLAFGVAAPLAFIIGRSQGVAAMTEVIWRKIPWIVAAAFILALPMLDHKLHQKDREHLQLVAQELSRPVDSWLSLVVNEGLRTVAEARDVWHSLVQGHGLSHSDRAFGLWSQTLVGREGYNSALFVYDTNGKELSRFSVGLTSYEQTEMLRTMFNAEEEMLQVVERKSPAGTLTYYGAWTTVRDTANKPIGFVALVLSANERSLFRGEAPEPLRPFTRGRFERHVRDILVSEFHNGALTTTNTNHLFRGMPLNEGVAQALQTDPARFLWRTESYDGQEFETLYVRDEARPGVVLALSLEILDIRWHMFNTVKTVPVYLAVVVLVLIGKALARGIWREVRTLGFRARLLIAFSILTIVPFFLLAYYNRQLATERLETSMSRRLAEDLNLLERRMLQTFEDEQDFLNGMTDDFCEAVASEFGVDFTVYRGSAMKASSKPELYQAAILDSRLSGQAFANTVLLGRNFFHDVEQVGDVPYTVGYKPLLFDDRVVGVIAVQALYRQREIDEELAQRNAYTVGVYSLLLAGLIILGLLLAHRLSMPLRELTQAAREVGRGNLNVQVHPSTTDEVGELMRSFNEMVNELREHREQIARVERESAWKEMAKQVAHEIKNPLTPMKLSVQHLRRAFKDGAPDFPNLLDRITQTVIDQVDALSRIASEFSNFARMPERTYERVDIRQLILETINLFKEIRGIEFRTNFSDTSTMIVADRGELQRVFINLIRNSVQAMERGGTITITTSVEDQRCTIAVSDTGPGIPSDLQQKVFEPNFSTKSDGTGLGLAISRRIIEDLNGTLELSSQVGKGTTFTITLPTQSIPHG